MKPELWDTVLEPLGSWLPTSLSATFLTAVAVLLTRSNLRGLVLAHSLSGTDLHDGEDRKCQEGRVWGTFYL